MLSRDFSIKKFYSIFTAVMSDPFLVVAKKSTKPGRKRSYKRQADEEIDSDEFDSENEQNAINNREVEEDEDLKNETKTQKRRRLAKEYLKSIEDESRRPQGIRESEHGDTVIAQELLDYNNFDAEEMDKDIIARRLQQDATKQKGYIHKFIGSSMKFARKKVLRTLIGGHTMNPTDLAIHYPFLYVVSKDIQLAKYDISNLKKAPKRVKYVKYSGASDDFHTGEIKCCAVNSTGKYVVTGGNDGKILICDTLNLSVLKILELPKRSKPITINSMSFRDGTSELYVACDDLKIRIYNVGQFSLIDTLYGHQDKIIGITSLSQERCVTVGLRDRSAMYWKIPEQTRLAFNSGVSFEKYYNTLMRENRGKLLNNEETKESLKKQFVAEGSLECVSMVDNTHFVTGSDNGNISLWSISKKKPIFTVFKAHGDIPVKMETVSADRDYLEEISEKDMPVKPYWITSIYSVPYSDVFVTGSWNGELRVWKISENLRGFSHLYTFRGVNGVVTGIEAAEKDDKIAVFATVAREHKFGRWVGGGKNMVYSVVISVGAKDEGEEKEEEKE